MKKAAGFTLIELVVAMGILTIVFFLGIELVSAFQQAMGKQSAKAVAIGFQTASRKARDGLDGTAWGIYVPYDDVTRRSDEMIIFSGDSYETREVSRDLSYPISNDLKFTSFKDDPVSAGNDHQIVFASISGEIGAAAEIILEYYGGTTVISISSAGFAASEPL